MENIYLSSLAISIIGRCPLACKHCYELSGPNVSGQFNFEQVKNLIDIFKTKGIKHVFFGGGEPLCNPELPLMIKYVTDLGIHANISTNGHPISEEILEKLYNAGLTHDFSVSLDGPNIVVSDSVRGKGSFIPSIQGMYKLNKFGKILWGVNFVSCKLNYGYALDTALLAEKLGASYFNLIRVTPLGRGKSNKDRLLISDEEYKKESSFVSSVFNSFGNLYNDVLLYDLSGTLITNAKSYFNDKDFKGLPSGISVNHLGDISLTPANIKLGNYFENSMLEIVDCLESSRINNLYNLWLKNELVGIHQPIIQES